MVKPVTPLVGELVVVTTPVPLIVVQTPAPPDGIVVPLSVAVVTPHKD